MNIDLGNIHLDVYLHDTTDPVQVLLKQILTQGAAIVSTLSDVKAQLDAIKTSISGISGDIAGLKQTIEDLKNQAVPVTQEQLDSLFTDVSAVADSLSSLDAQTPTPPTT